MEVMAGNPPVRLPPIAPRTARGRREPPACSGMTGRVDEKLEAAKTAKFFNV